VPESKSSNCCVEESKNTKDQCGQEWKGTYMPEMGVKKEIGTEICTRIKRLRI
jgi:hypothetical protein